MELKTDVGRSNLVSADMLDVPGLDVHTVASQPYVAVVSQGTEGEEGHVELGAGSHDEGPQCLVTASPLVVDGHQVWLWGKEVFHISLIGKDLCHCSTSGYVAKTCVTV